MSRILFLQQPAIVHKTILLQNNYKKWNKKSADKSLGRRLSPTAWPYIPKAAIAAFSAFCFAEKALGKERAAEAIRGNTAQ